MTQKSFGREVYSTALYLACKVEAFEKTQEVDAILTICRINLIDETKKHWQQEVLNLERNQLNSINIRSTFNRLSRVVHADKNQNLHGCHSAFIMLNSARKSLLEEIEEAERVEKKREAEQMASEEVELMAKKRARMTGSQNASVSPQSESVGRGYGLKPYGSCRGVRGNFVPPITSNGNGVGNVTSRIGGKSDDGLDDSTSKW